VTANPVIDSCELAYDFCRAIGARIVDSEQLVVDSLGTQGAGETEQRRPDRPFLVMCRDDDG
jgi:hypothetical protein